MPTATPPNPVARFEAALAELEAIVQKMERGELSLDDSLAAYEQGTRLVSECSQALETAELKIKTLAPVAQA